MEEKVVVFVSLTASKLAKLLTMEGNFSKIFLGFFFPPQKVISAPVFQEFKNTSTEKSASYHGPSLPLLGVNQCSVPYVSGKLCSWKLYTLG